MLINKCLVKMLNFEHPPPIVLFVHFVHFVHFEKWLTIIDDALFVLFLQLFALLAQYQTTPILIVSNVHVGRTNPTLMPLCVLIVLAVAKAQGTTDPQL